jgi:hypothetical protein
MATVAIATILVSSPALSDSPDQIRSVLLGTPVWLYAWAQSKDHPDAHGGKGKIDTGKISFVDKDGKLVAAIDEGVKCNNEVRLRPDGFDLEDCWGRDLQYVRSGNEFMAKFGSMTFTIRSDR